jgi:cytochrome c oxidase cbb3-type subunit 3
MGESVKRERRIIWQRCISRQTGHAALVCAAVAVALTGCDPPKLPGTPDPANRPSTPSEVTSFAKLFSLNCAGCHGADGELGPAPPLNDANFLAIIPPEELERVVRNGRRGTPMPGFSHAAGGTLTDEQVTLLIEGLKKHWGDAKIDAASLPPYLLTRGEGVQSVTGSRERGAQVFERACATCHGANGAGVDRDGVVGGAINVPAFLALTSDQALRRIIITGRQDLGMPTYAEGDGRPADFKPLTPAEIDDLVALLADWRATGGMTRTAAP